MPGVAYLEMARTAIIQAMGVMVEQEPSRLCLNHVVWARPLVCDPARPVTVHIILEAQESGTVSFLISRDGVCGLAIQEEETVTQTLVCQGRAILCAESTVQSLDLAAVQARCQHQISASECYQRYRSLGMSYGPALQGIEQLSVGEGEALVQLRLSEAVAQTRTDFVLHPSVLDAALQACVGLLIEQHEIQEPQVPFALDDLTIIGMV